MASDERIPDRLFYRIGEVARIVGVKPHVLRFWEKEFDFIRPEKSHGRQRLYRRCELDLLCRIKTLLHDERYTIEGTRKKIKQENQSRSTPEACLNQLRDEISAIRDLIKENQ